MLQSRPNRRPFWSALFAVAFATIGWLAISIGILYAADILLEYAPDLLELTVAAFTVFVLWMVFMFFSVRFLSKLFAGVRSEISSPLLANEDSNCDVLQIPWTSSCFAVFAIFINLIFITWQISFLAESDPNFTYQKNSAILRIALTCALILFSPFSALRHGVISAVVLNQMLLILDIYTLRDNANAYVLLVFANSACFVYTRLEQIFSSTKRDGYDGSTVFSMYTFWWVFPALAKSKAAGKLESSDFPVLSVLDGPKLLINKFYDIYQTGGFPSSISRSVNLLISTTYSVQKSIFLSSYFNGIAFLCCMFTDPILLSALLSQPSARASWLLMVGLSLSMLIRVSCMEVCFFLSTRVANNVRTVICQALFSSSIRSRKLCDPAKLANLMATDADKLGQWSWGVFFIAQWTWAVVSLPFVIYFLRQVVGNGAFLGVSCLLSTGLVSWAIGKYLSALELRLQICRDERARCLRSFLASVKIMKLENLQSVWIDRMEYARQQELHQLTKIRYAGAASDLICSFLSLSVPVSMFAWRICVDKLPLTAEVAFVSLAWIAQMQWSISTLPAIYQAWSSLQPSFDRLAAQLQDAEEVQLLPLSEVPTVEDNILKGLLIFVGPTGSGKSTLLANLASQKCAAYVRQRPFLMNGTIKENIIFGLDIDEQHLQDVIERTNLDPDLRTLPNGLETQIGPNGVQLSGGQKARVCLARAIYSNSDLLLLDDIFSALDRTTGSHIWKHVVCHYKQLNKTVVLVTHELRFLSSPVVDNVVLMCDGRIITSGPFSSFDKNVLEQYSKHLSEEEVKREVQVDNKPLSKQKDSSENTDGLSLKETFRFFENLLKMLKGKVIDDSLIYNHILIHLKPDFSHSEQSARNTGSISIADLTVYLREFGWFFVPVILLAICEAAASVLSNVWLSIWSGSSSIRDNAAQKRFLVIYSLIGVFYLILVFFQALVRAKCSLIVAYKIHQKMIARLVEAPLSYFDTHSSGLILNRFLQDLSNIDGSVPSSLFSQISKTLGLIVQFMLIASYAPFVFILLPFMALIYVSIFQMIRTAARDTRRIEAEARSPVYQLFHDILEGREVIQCAHAESRFENINRNKVQDMSTAKVGNEAIMKWAQALTTQSSCILYLLTGCLSLMLIDRGKMNLAQLGLVLYYAAVIQRGMMDYLMGLTSVETNFVSVERIGQVLRIPIEEEQSQVCIDRDLDGWPTKGNLDLKDVALRYAFNRSEALKGITIQFPAGVKVAIIGRTGCGKSSLVSALSSLYPISRGSINVDDVSLDQVSLSVARQVVRVIPQDPILFSGSIRSNIVINKEVPDSVIWSVLERTNLATLIRRLGGLDAQLTHDGINLSAGERQLLCMARAFVMGIPKILLCDEPTSNIDRYTGTIITDLLLSLDITVLMVMHRLESLNKFDRVLLLENGKIAAYGETKQLLSDPNSPVRVFIDHQNV